MLGIIFADEKLKMINEEQGTDIIGLMDSFENDPSLLSEENAELLEKSRKRYNPQVYHPNYNLGYHLLAVLARYISDKLNTMDIDTFFKSVLSYADMIQIYASVAIRGKDAYFDKFTVKYPPEFEGTIDIDPDTNYYASSKPKGKITFKLKK